MADGEHWACLCRALEGLGFERHTASWGQMVESVAPLAKLMLCHRKLWPLITRWDFRVAEVPGAKWGEVYVGVCRGSVGGKHGVSLMARAAVLLA